MKSTRFIMVAAIATLSASVAAQTGQAACERLRETYSDAAYLTLLSSIYDNHPTPPDLGLAHPQGARRLNLLEDLAAPDRIGIRRMEQPLEFVRLVWLDFLFFVVQLPKDLTSEEDGVGTQECVAGFERC